MSLLGKHVVSSVVQIEQLAAQLVQEIHPGDVLALSGELGAGKTTFTQAFARALGVQDVVTSPTFTIVGEYEVHGRDDLDWLVHIDLYRIPEDGRGVDRPYIDDIMQSAQAQKRVIVIEWPERFGETQPDTAWKLQFEHGKLATDRIVTIESTS